MMNLFSRPRSGQSEMLEYVFLTFLIMIVIVVIILFFTGWQATQLQLERSKGQTDRALFLLKYVSESPLLVRDVAQFDDRKLAAFAVEPEACEQFGDLVGGREWFFEVTALDGNPTTDCTAGSVDCNRWTFCKRPDRFTAFALPVNVFRTFSSATGTDFMTRTEIGLLTVGVYEP